MPSVDDLWSKTMLCVLVVCSDIQITRTMYSAAGAWLLTANPVARLRPFQWTMLLGECCVIRVS
jgi:hypothetical protein